MQVPFDIEKVVVFIRPGHPDNISVRFVAEAPTTYPEMKYPLTCDFLAEAGKGQSWVRTNLKIEPEVVEITNKRKVNQPEEADPASNTGGT